MKDIKLRAIPLAALALAITACATPLTSDSVVCFYNSDTNV
jgi:hypothetical protein